MFRFVSTDFDNHPEEVLYLEKIASQTIVAGLRACYQLKADDNCFWMMIEPYFPENFFSDFAQYVGMKDDTAAGVTFIREKVSRMIEKMMDEKKVYTFDVFEELLFAISIMSAQDEIDFCKEVGYKKKNPYINRKQATAVVNELMARFGYSDREAKQAANEVLRFDKMLLSDDEDDNLFFWDDDYAFFFEKGFIEGINRLKSLPAAAANA